MLTGSREEQLLGYFRQHFEDEVAGDVEKTLAGCTDDIVYEHPFASSVMHGIDRVRRYYNETWTARPFKRLEIVRHWMSGEDTILVEVDSDFGPPANERARALCVGIFRGDKLAKEIVYTGTPTPLT
jgi:predicted SnoaL-like aldol condensation-catalyzing enzyme